jgi:hypothetical protein
MKFVRALLIATALTSCAFPGAGYVKVIANRSLTTDTISSAELKSIFLEETRSLDNGSHAEPVLEKGGTVHEAFLRQYIGKARTISRHSTLLWYSRAEVLCQSNLGRTQKF